MNIDIEEKIKFYANTLRARLGDNLKTIILFGSRAREDYDEGSDYDFVVIVSKKDADVREIVLNTAVDFLNKYDELVAELLFNQQEWEKQKRLPFGINVERDGVLI